MSTPRSSGGAVPGGRGIGTVDVGQEESRDAEYRARTRSTVGALGLLTMQEALANDKTMDGMTPSRAGSAKKTPSSVRAKRGSMSTPMTTSATGAFVDHVVQLPADDDEDVAGKQRTPANRKQPAQASLVGSRAPSSVGLSGTVREVEAVGHGVGGSSRDETGKEKRQGGNGVGDTGKRRTRPAHEAVEDQHAPQPVPNPKPKPHHVERRSHVQTDQSDVEVEIQAPAQRSKPRRRAKGMTIGSDSDPHSDAGESEGSEGSVPPRKATGGSSTTPVKSGMKPRPRSVLGGEGGDEGRVVAGTATGTGTGKQREEAGKPTRNGGVVTKGKEKGKRKEGKKETDKVIPRPRSPTRSPSPTSPDTKNSRTPKRRLSVLVPSMPKDYFASSSVGHAIEADGEGDREHGSEKKRVDASTTLGSRHKQLAPAASMRAVAAEASASTSKHGKPSPAKISTTVTASRKSMPQSKAKAKPKPGVSKDVIKTRAADNGEDMSEEGEDNSISIIVDIPMTSTSRGGPRRSAANKATARLREEIMPDVVSFEREQKQAKRRRGVGGESVASWGGEDEDKEERGGKRRKMATQEKEEEEEAEVEDVVLVSSVETKLKPINGKGRAKGTTVVGSDEDMDKKPAKNKSSESHERKGARGRVEELAAIRLMTTGVSLLDDVIKVSLPRQISGGVSNAEYPNYTASCETRGTDDHETNGLYASCCQGHRSNGKIPLCHVCLTVRLDRGVGERKCQGWQTSSCVPKFSLNILVADRTPPSFPAENDYFLSDAAAEQKWAFKFADAMARAKKSEGGPSLFKQMTFYVTPKVSVDTKLFKNVVSAGGGQVQTSTMPTARILKGKAHRYVISCPEDKAIWRPLVQEGFKVYSPELVLRGALRQEIEWENEECLVAG